jgi:hypothetical protein
VAITERRTRQDIDRLAELVNAPQREREAEAVR